MAESPTKEEIRELVNSIPKKEIIELLSISRNAIYEWLRGDKVPMKANYVLMRLYKDGVIDLNCKATASLCKKQIG